MATATSQNGWPVIDSTDDPRLHLWIIPTRRGPVRLWLRSGSAGFLLAHLILFIADVIEPLVGKVLDDWGWAKRLIRGSATVTSNHASGTAADVNALKHARGVRGTWLYLVRGITARDRILKRLAMYEGAIRWGECYEHATVDGMHFEIDDDLEAVEKLARHYMTTRRGKRILKWNPGQAAVILS